MGARSRDRLGDAFIGESEFENEESLASLMEAFEEAAKAVAEDATGRSTTPEEEDRTFDVRIEVKARTHNQNVKTYRVIITPGT